MEFLEARGSLGRFRASKLLRERWAPRVCLLRVALASLTHQGREEARSDGSPWALPRRAPGFRSLRVALGRRYA